MKLLITPLQLTFLILPMMTMQTVFASELTEQNLEDHFHQIYQKYNQQPTDRETWDQALSLQKSRIYQVQTKDTLWDVSKTLFADSYFWPKIWAQNTISIDNPHEIDPNMEIEFYPGTFDDAPSISFVNIQSAEDKNKKQRVRVLIPPQMHKPQKLVRQLPDSLPLYQYAQKPVPKKEWKISSRSWGSQRESQLLREFVTERIPENIGQVVSTELGTVAAHQYQYVFVQLKKTGVKNVKLMQVIDHLKKSNKDSSSVTAQVVQVQGQLEVIEEVAGRPGLYKALVTHEVNPIQVGASLFEGELEAFQVQSHAQASESSAAEIVGGPLAQKTDLGQIEDYLYLGAGSTSGFSVGQVVQVYSRAQAYRPIGKVQIVHVAAGFSTGFIIEQENVIEVGDFVGGEKGGRPQVIIPVEHLKSEKSNQSTSNDEQVEEMTTEELNLEQPTAPSANSEGQQNDELDDSLIDEKPEAVKKEKKQNEQGLKEEINQSEDLEFEDDSTGEELSRKNETNEEVPSEVDMSGDQH